ncbi:WD repeat-containing protein 93-like isoform X2 [Octopus sinensis]|uniref:WD repeat-containing protein 93-like isoform X2 n=1 Tax=Octopus sinensis TaxID=2607531 RepID=A0A7E6ERE0_9MOLL|nr:WD repeat-containing protein 93-like isoform X2 [Octopus sinensis]
MIPRVSRSFDKKSSSNASRSDYYLADPELWRDTLPQPYRMLDKILNEILETVWSEIQHRQDVKLSQRSFRIDDSFISPVCCTATQTVQVPKINSFSGCNGSIYSSLGTKDGLYILDASTQEICAMWKSENSEIQSVSQYFLDTQTFAITALDDVGTARIFMFRAPNNLILTFSLPDQQSEVKPQSFVTHCAASPQADYFGAVMDGSATGKESQLEIYKLSFGALFEQFLEPHVAINQVPDGNSPGNEKQVAILFLRIPNISSPQACRASSLNSAFKYADSTGDVIGNGNSHILSKSYFDSRTYAFQSHYSDMMKYLPEKESLPRIQNFKFIQPDPALECGVNNTTPPSLLVWSTNCHILNRYSLVKPKKDSESPDPDMVWPFAAAIKIVTTSLCTTRIAVGLENGFIIIWDYHLGILSGVFDLSKEGSFKDLYFLSLNTPPNNQQPYSISCHLIAILNSGLVQYITYTDGSYSMTTLLPASRFAEAALNKVVPISGKNDLLLMTFNNGVILLTEVINGQTLCELELPPSYKPLPIWDPVIASIQIKPDPSQEDAVLSEATYVYVNASFDDANGIHTDENTSFFKFRLDTIPILETFYKETNTHMATSFVVETSLESLLENILKTRHERQWQRNIRLKSQWAKLPSLIPEQNVFN